MINLQRFEVKIESEEKVIISTLIQNPNNQNILVFKLIKNHVGFVNK